MKNLPIYATIVIASICAWIIAMVIATNYSDKKNYPIKVLVSHGYNCLTFEADSVRRDTIYKDNSYIVNKNIVNVIFE